MFLACVLFGVAALLGATMFSWRLLTHSNPPRYAVFLHALVILCAFGTLVYAALTGPHPQNAWMALLPLSLAATAGGYLAFVDHKHELLQVDQVAVHGAFALTGYTALWVLTLATH
jgi:hypothetical protein